MMGSGKTRVGGLAAARLGVPFRDTDREVSARSGRSIPEIFRDAGEEAFRREEGAVLEEVARGAPAVVATGGGVVLDEANVALMRRSGVVVWLDVPTQVLADRLGDGAGRPLLEEVEQVEGSLEEILARRRPLYAQAAHHRIESGARSADQVAEEVAGLWPAAGGDGW